MLSILALIKGAQASKPTAAPATVQTSNGAAETTLPPAAPVEPVTTVPTQPDTVLPPAAPVSGVPFGGKAHTLTDEDRRKGQETRKAKIEAAKAAEAAAKEAKKAAQREEREAARAAKEAQRKAEKSKNYASDLHATFNYLVGRPQNVNFYHAEDLACNVREFVGNVALDLPGVRFGKLLDGRWELVLKHRATDTTMVVVLNGKISLYFATADATTLDQRFLADLPVLLKRAGL